MKTRRFAVLASGCLVTTAVGFLAGLPWLLPFLAAAVPYPYFVRDIARGRPYRAFRWVLVWALLQSLVVGGATLLAPERAGDAVFRGRPYAAEMLHWVRTGEGPEGSPRLYLPIHTRHFLAFSAASLVTAGAGGLVLGAALLDYMNVYVAELVRASEHRVAAAALGWPPWAVLRVLGFVAVGTALTALSLRLIGRMRGTPPPPFPRALLLAGILLVLVDAGLKAVLAPAWQALLLRVLGAGS